MRKDWIIIALCVTSFCFSDAQGPTAKFSDVTVQGIVKTTRLGRDVYSFFGIPYAEPPIGPLRFRDPIPKVYRDGSTLIADKPQIRCLQSIASVLGDANSTRYVKGDEDCLYLSIHRPASAGNEPLPVMVYFQAADLLPGIKDVSYIGPDYLLDKDIVLVTVTYRLGVFGFFSTWNKAAPGNLALKDQKVALEWIQSNIAGFGGDRNRVTLFGQGEAAKLIHLHALVNHTAGLFHQYILQSGNALAPWAVQHGILPLIWGRKFGSLNRCDTFDSLKMVDCLRKIDSRQLLELSYQPFSPRDIHFNRMWGPIREPKQNPAAFLTDCPETLIARGWQRDLPFIAGLTDEQNYFRASARFGDDDWEDQSYLVADDTYHFILGYSGIHERVQLFYHFENLDSDDPIPVGRGYEDHAPDTIFDYFVRLGKFLDDFSYSSPQVKMLEERKKNSKSPFYFYSFEYQGQFRTGNWLYNKHAAGLATYGDDLLYLFHHDKSEFPGSKNHAMDDGDYQIVDTMVELWTSFATEGVPRSRYVETWNPYGSEGDYLQIAVPAVPNSKYRWKRMMYWDNIDLKTCD